MEVEICEALASCPETISSLSKGDGWDWRVVVAWLGLGGSLIWNFVNWKSARGTRQTDKKWEAFKDEIYTPILALLREFDEVAKPETYAARYLQLNEEKRTEWHGEIFAVLAQIEVLCVRADAHSCAKRKLCTHTHETLQAEIHKSLGKASGNGNPTALGSVIQAALQGYKNGLSDLMAAERQCILGLKNSKRAWVGFRKAASIN